MANSSSSPSNKLAAHIAKLQAREDKKPLIAKDALLFWGTSLDKEYLHQLKACVGSATTYLRMEKVDTLMQVSMYCASKGITRIISSSPSLLAKVLHWDKRAAPKLSNYAGSYFTITPFKDTDPDIEIVFIPPIKQIVTVPYGKFLATRLISKLTEPDKWYKATEFSWQLLTPANEAQHFHYMQDCFLVSMDIETFRENATIRCISYTGFRYVDESIESFSVVLPLDSEYNLLIMRKWNWELQAPKVFQNGKYDISYLARYNAPVYNYLYDTANMFHSWLSELPKDLGFLNAFLIREAVYWKDLAETNDLYEYYKYNALDTWGTGNALLAMLLELPDWAEQNYLREFPLTFPCHLAEMTGIERDMSVLEPARADMDAEIETLSKRLDTILGVKGFNVKSSPQMKSVLKILGCGDLKSADEKSLKKARFRHPFNARIINLVLKVRELRTLREKYLQVGDKAKEFHRMDGTGNRILFALNPHGTDSSRLASREHHFWCGLQIQNIPRGDSVKRTLKADDGFYIAEVDLEQAESRDTAYISGEPNLIEAVEHSPDFHSSNASNFFGVPFEEIYDVVTGKVLQKPLRQLAKPVNHGANYNMGAFILIETMGEENILKAKQLLGLNRFWSYKQVAEYLLEQFHKTYPGIKKVFYKGVVEEIEGTGLLAHHLMRRPATWDATKDSDDVWEVDPETLTRMCFGKPSKSKPALNAYIAHPPQSLNAQSLNKAFMRVFFEIAMNPQHSANFKLIAQIHDSILFQYRIGHSYLCDTVKDLMEIPVTVEAYDGKIRTFCVPAGVKNGKDGKEATYWSETE
jgi:DNA polymerase I-like protein with 3'-5' exonuclease and polymerase domains